MEQQLEKSNLESNILQLIVFRLGDEEFAADITQVREIISSGQITPIPDSPDFISGISNVRGEIAIVVDLTRRFKLNVDDTREQKHIIMTEQANNLFGLHVDAVSEVLRMPESDIKPTPDLVSKIDRSYMRGVLSVDERLIIMLDLSKVLSEDELRKLSKLHSENADQLIVAANESGDESTELTNSNESDDVSSDEHEEKRKKE